MGSGGSGAAALGHIRFRVWKAEDGRCELCGRAMDRRVAAVMPRRAAPVALADWVLVCPFCYQGSRPPFAELKVDKTVAAVFSTGLGMDKPHAASWLRQALDQYGVIIQLQQKSVQVWLPGIGRGWVRCRAEAPPILRQWDRPADAPWTVTVKPQSRTRGLPTPPVTDREPWRGFNRGANQTIGVTPMKPAEVRAIKVAVTLPPDQWPKDVARVTTAQMELTFRTPQGVTVTAVVKTKSARKAEKTMGELRARGQVPIIVVQGQLMPEGRLEAAGFQVQGREP